MCQGKHERPHKVTTSPLDIFTNPIAIAIAIAHNVTTSTLDSFTNPIAKNVTRYVSVHICNRTTSIRYPC